MPFYEVLATVSITLALAIPTFLEKVMRAGYEKRAESYKNGVIQEFRDVFLEAFNEFNEVQCLTEDIEGKIGEVVSMWEDVRTNYHKLETFIKNRVYLTLGWFAVFLCCIGAIYSETYNVVLFNVIWDELSNFLFVSLLIITSFYVYQLLKFDYDLTRYSERKFDERLILGDDNSSIKDKVESIREYAKENELLIENTLKKQNIKFEKEAMINDRGVDFVIPNSQYPRIIIETKFTRREGNLPHFIYGSIIGRFALLKKELPEIKTVLITNFDLSKYPTRYKDLMKFTDAVIRVEKIEKLSEFIKNNLKH